MKFDNLKITNLKNFDDIKKFKPQIVSICSPFEKLRKENFKIKE